MWDHAREPRSRAENHEIGTIDRSHGIGARGRIGREQSHTPNLARGGRDGNLSTNAAADAGVLLESLNVGFDLERDRRHRQHTATDSQQSRHLVECDDRIAEHLGQSGQDEIAHRMPGKCADTAEAMLNGPSPVDYLGFVRRESCQRHPEVSRRDDAEFGAQPARRTTVVGDRDHGGDVDRQASDGLERGEQSVPAAERDDGRPLGCLPRAMCRFTHSRPRSRCTMLTEMSSSEPKRLARASDMATLRCLPPVHPTAIVM